GNMDYSSLNPQDADDNRLRQTGVYVIDHVEIGRVVVSGALRHDRTTSETLAVSGPNSSQDDQATTGRLGLMYRFDFGLSPYISYSEAFVPNLGTNSTGESLDPTTGEQKEVGVKYLSPARDFAVNAAWFD
ncbi:TonB-dependent receptor domain-containing protein, partial [Acinetobacter baumannii]|uniref:TonB-dependent receptor domain-containing protein n=1 Tax=Acinetobacter baumannii TaxID=470 RepID=UPI0018975E57